MSDYPFTIEPLGNQERTGFSCGVEPLDRYLHTQVKQDGRRRVSACYIALEAATGRIAGYYTLSAAEVPLLDIPSELGRKLPRYPAVPVARVGRLAVDHRYRGQKLGSVLLLNAAVRAARSEVAVYALVVDAKDEDAAAFYRHHGFVAYGTTTRQLMVPIDRFRDLLK